MVEQYAYESDHVTTRVEHRQQQALLRKLLPKARAMVKEAQGTEFRPGGAVAAGLHGSLRIDNVDAVDVHQGPHGGWFADLVLKEVPLGTPMRFGTPSDEPLPDREAAVKFGIRLLAFIIAIERTDVNRKTPAHAGFVFYGIELHVPRRALEAVKPHMSEDPRTEAEFEERLSELRQEFFGDNDPTEERLSALDESSQMRFFAVVAIALLRGYVQWPKPELRGLTI